MKRKNILIHVGAPKTGTTALQNYWHKNSALLLRENIAYDSSIYFLRDAPFRATPARDFCSEILSGRMFKTSLTSDIEFSLMLDDAINEICLIPQEQIIISNESLWEADKNRMRICIENLIQKGFDVTILVTVRHILNYTVSRYVQRLRAFKESDGIADFVGRTITDIPNGVCKWADITSNVASLKIVLHRKKDWSKTIMEVLGLSAIVDKLMPESRAFNTTRIDYLDMLITKKFQSLTTDKQEHRRLNNILRLRERSYTVPIPIPHKEVNRHKNLITADLIMVNENLAINSDELCFVKPSNMFCFYTPIIGIESLQQEIANINNVLSLYAHEIKQSHVAELQNFTLSELQNHVKVH